LVFYIKFMKNIRHLPPTLPSVLCVLAEADTALLGLFKQCSSMER
jgi:hypothetical protein